MGGISESEHFIWKYELISDVCVLFILFTSSDNYWGVYLTAYLYTSSENMSSYLISMCTSSCSLHLTTTGGYIWQLICTLHLKIWTHFGFGSCFTEVFSTKDQQVKNNISLRKMELTTIKRISKLKLNRWGRWVGWKNQKHQDGVSKANLCGVEKSYHDWTLFSTGMTVTITLSTIQSVRNKENKLLEYLTDSNFDACILTETWLKDTDEHVAWLNCSSLNTNSYRMITSNRPNRLGGGLAVVYKSSLSVKTLEQGVKKSFEYTVWSLKTNSTSLAINGIYRPPYSMKNPVNISMFTDEFSDWVANHLTKHNNIIIGGDFNVHINKASEEDDPGMSLDTMEALGLKQNIHFPTQWLGNIIDLVFTEDGGNIVVSNSILGPYLSDHRMVNCILTIPRCDVETKQVTYRKISEIYCDHFIDDSHLDRMDYDSLKDVVFELDARMKNALSKHAPEITKTVIVWNRFPWYNEEFKEQRYETTQRYQENEYWGKSTGLQGWQ